METTAHFENMMKERNIPEAWVVRTLETPDNIEKQDDGTQHYFKQIPEYGNRWLHIVINTKVNPHRKVTLFFDRRQRRKP